MTTSQVGGVVAAILADNTDHIKTGQTLVTLNAVDVQLALDGAEAQLTRTVRLSARTVSHRGTRMRECQAKVD
nr:biotin/lipoyl-binding protein [Cupriavidus pauculus]